jgi:hypothetical protein
MVRLQERDLDPHPRENLQLTEPVPLTLHPATGVIRGLSLGVDGG